MRAVALHAAIVAALLPALAPARADAPAPTVVELRRPADPEWFGLYLMGRKAGWSRSWIGLERRAGERVLVARMESTISATVGDRAVERRQVDEKVYQARPGGRLLAFSSRREGDGGVRSVQGRCTPKGCRATLVSEGLREERELPPTAETAEQADAARLAAALRGTVRGSQLEPEQLREKKMVDAFKERGTLAGAGVEVAVSVVDEREEGDRAAAVVSIADDGRIVEMRYGEAVVARAEPEEIAKRLDRVDLFGLTRVKLPAPLPRSVPGAVVFRLRGVPKEFQKDDDRQVWTPGRDGETVLTVTARRPAAADPARDAPRARMAPRGGDELLAPTPEVDADAPAIRKLAAEVVGSTPTVYAASAKIARHVFRRLDKVYGASRDRASEVLTAGKGDCTEHALLFLALARASGVPSRQVHGLVFASYEDRVPALYWHAWVEVRSGNEWIALDPTFGEDVADATHVALGRGTQVDTVGLLGALQVEAADPGKPLP